MNPIGKPLQGILSPNTYALFCPNSATTPKYLHTRHLDYPSLYNSGPADDTIRRFFRRGIEA